MINIKYDFYFRHVVKHSPVDMYFYPMKKLIMNHQIFHVLTKIVKRNSIQKTASMLTLLIVTKVR